VRENRTHGLTGGDWKRTVAYGTAPVPDPPRSLPVGIPAIADRALQALTVNALEPEWEARFELRSYGFRPGRGCHDAIKAIHQAGKGRDARLHVKIAISSICAG
jgi:retron-type reverse transcriptase